jgi:hypothetical protein
MKVYIEDYSSNGGGSLEQYADLFFTSRTGTPPTQTNPPTAVTGGSTSLDVAGFSVTWSDVMYFPTGCSKFEFRYVNNLPRKLLRAGFTLTDKFGDSIAQQSLIGADPGRTGIWNVQICNHNLETGLGPYRMKVYIEDYSSNGGGSLEQYADLFFTSRTGTPPTQTNPPGILPGDARGSDEEGSKATASVVANGSRKFNLTVRVRNASGQMVRVFFGGVLRAEVTATSSDFSFRASSGKKGRRVVEVTADSTSIFLKAVRVR